MDSLSQVALGAAVGVAVMGRRTAVWKAALWGAVAGTLPDLDVLIDHGDPIRNMVLHRGPSHSLFWLTLFSPLLGAVAARLSGPWPLWRRWWLAMWAALVTHPLLDALTVYGTQLALPFSNHPYGVGSVFIIDPLYTLPLLLGVGWALADRRRGLGPVPGGRNRGAIANGLGLALSTGYLLWGVAVQQHVEAVARAALAKQGIAIDQLLVTPAPLNTVLWRVVAVSGDAYHEGFYSLFDATPDMAFDRFPRGNALAAEVQGIDGVRRIMAFSKGLYKVDQVGSTVRISDLRMGQEPHYSFTFAVAERRSPIQTLPQPVAVGGRINLQQGLQWLWRRALGEPLPPPR